MGLALALAAGIVSYSIVAAAVCNSFLKGRQKQGNGGRNSRHSTHSGGVYRAIEIHRTTVDSNDSRQHNASRPFPVDAKLGRALELRVCRTPKRLCAVYKKTPRPTV